jgi:hypothetical protein
VIQPIDYGNQWVHRAFVPESDGIPNAQDNCDDVTNPGQENFDADGAPVGNGPGMGNGPDIPGHDATVPNGDGLGDACDEDDDNDGIPDSSDGVFTGCGSSPGGHPNAARGDITNADGNGPSWDTDNDQVPDGVECFFGTDPRVASSAHRTTCANAVADGDNDGDGLQNDWEICKWRTDSNDSNTDADSPGDCREAFDLNGNGFVTNADALFVRQAAFGQIVGDWTFDVNGNGAITNTDATFISQAIFGVNPCA